MARKEIDIMLKFLKEGSVSKVLDMEFKEIDSAVDSHKQKIIELKREYRKFASDRRRSLETIKDAKDEMKGKVAIEREHIEKLQFDKKLMKDVISQNKAETKEIQKKMDLEDQLYDKGSNRAIIQKLDKEIGGTDLKESREAFKEFYTEKDKAAKQDIRNTDMQTKMNRRFRGEYLSLMFAGMAMAAVFQGPISQMAEMFRLVILENNM